MREVERQASESGLRAAKRVEWGRGCSFFYFFKGKVNIKKMRMLTKKTLIFKIEMCSLCKWCSQSQVVCAFRIFLTTAEFFK